MTAAAPTTGWSSTSGAPTTVILLRHGVTAATERKLFSGSGGVDHELSERGMAQAAAAADWINQRFQPDAIVVSPLTRTRQTAEPLARALGIEPTIEAGFVEVDFGEWDGLSFADIGERWPAERDAWLASRSVAPPGGESLDLATARVLAARDALLRNHAGRTVVVVSHVSPIKILVRDVLGAGPDALYRMELSAASISTIVVWPDGNASLRAFNIVP